MKNGFIAQRSDGCWYAAIPDSSKAGGYRRKGGFGKKSQASTYLNKYEPAFQNIQTEDNAKGDILINVFFKDYLAWAHNRFTYETVKTYAGVIKDFNIFREQHYPRIQFLHELLNPKIFESYMDWMKDTGTLDDRFRNWVRQHHKSTTINNHMKVFKALFNVAIKWKYIKENPIKDVTLVNVDDEKKIITLDTPEKEKLFFDRCKKLKPEFYPHYFITAKTGLRFGEMTTLKWENIEFKTKTIHIVRSGTFSPKGRGRKDRKPQERFLPINTELEEILKSLPKENEYVFLYKGKPISRREKVFRRWIIEIVEGTELEGMTKFHELRHTAGDQLGIMGHSVQEIQRFLGHKDIKTTMRYIRIPSETMKRMAESLSNFGKTTQITTQK